MPVYVSRVVYQCLPSIYRTIHSVSLLDFKKVEHGAENEMESDKYMYLGKISLLQGSG